MEFSIIIPVYGVEKYLDECVMSLVNQSFSKDKYEIILVDDGSPDNCPKMCDEYSKKYDFVKTIHKKNGGLSDTRNVGIGYASGKYLLFIDSDDYIDSEMFLADIYNLVSEKDLDLIVFGRKKYFEKTHKFGEYTSLKINSNNKLIYSMIEQTFFRASACDKIIKRNIVLENSLYFKVGMTGEDIEWCGNVLGSVDLNKIGIYNSSVYVYRQREGSISKKDNSANMMLLIDMFYSMIKSGKNEHEYIINAYLAYEYAVRLGKISEKGLKDLSKNYKEKMYSMKYLLDYDVSNKVKVVKIINKIFGIKLTSKFLAMFISIKRLKG